jgi:mono/diheme cytochrome c family protein
MKEYLKYYGSVYVIVIIAIIVGGAAYITDLPNVMREKIGGMPPVVVKDSTMKDSTGGDLPIVKGVLSPPVAVAQFLNPTQQIIDKGKTTYSTTCASCHGADGKGDGVAGATLNPKPRNFHDLNGWKNGTSITMIYKTLEKGIPNTGMASFSNLSPEDRLSIIAYIRSLVPGYPPVTQQQIDSLDNEYSLTKGVKQPNQIPVQMAMDKIIKQSAPIDSMVIKMAALVKENKTDTGAFLLKGITNNLTNALTVLALDSAWNSSPQALVKIFDSNPVQNGFKARASYMLTQAQLNALHAYLRNLFASTKQ